jgi:hypothetical protein
MTKKSNAGRPTVFDKDTLQKLEYAFSIGCSDREACFYADIAESTLYNYQNNNPQFVERKHSLKNNPLFKARKTVYDNLQEKETAKWYLERKVKDEFSTRIENKNDNTTKTVEINLTPEEFEEKYRAVIKKIEEESK